ncbi:hypothetical protein Leryth_009542 [Lithospermum erythrorhizon]|uniref:CCT domain-containing protein n=1 Tax=Lithospermum erythrorhizon TaxID=34254 RepID=A0AAV3RLL6_LITER|nr:hypothetical protein Leryth_009542 [Lithospermum erythrorhizon]
MNGYNDDLITYSMEYADQFPFSEAVPVLTSSTLPPMIIPGSDYCSNSMLAMKPELGYCSSACSSYGSPSSMTSYVAENMSFLQRSTSSLSIQRSSDSFYHPLLSSPTAYNTESDSNSVRKVFSTGDLQHGTNMVQRRNHRSESPLSNEASVMECMNKSACRYSPEEKKEKIEKYRNKRNLRNFNKKIKYECRKTLADSRPRIRGRFARNDEIIEKTPENQWGIPTGGEYEEEYEYDDNLFNLLDVYSDNFVP